MKNPALSLEDYDRTKQSLSRILHSKSFDESQENNHPTYYQKGGLDFVKASRSFQDSADFSASKVQLAHKKKLVLGGIKTLEMINLAHSIDSEELSRSLNSPRSAKTPLMMSTFRNTLKRGRQRLKVPVLQEMIKGKEYISRQPMLHYMKKRISENTPFI